MQVNAADLFCEPITWVHIRHKKKKKMLSTKLWRCGQLSMYVSSLGLTGREETFWSFGSEGERRESKKAARPDFNRRSFTGGIVPPPSAQKPLVYLQPKSYWDVTRSPPSRITLKEKKKTQRAARWEARIKSDLEGDESDGGARVLNPSEWIWRSLTAAGRSLTQLCSFLKQNMSVCVFLKIFYFIRPIYSWLTTYWTLYFIAFIASYFSSLSAFIFYTVVTHVVISTSAAETNCPRPD